MRKYLLSLIIVVCSTAIYAQNPIAAYYGSQNGYPAWTDEINWSNQINMGSYTNGSNDFQKFENARDELYNAGGGVLYYPAGTYYFAIDTTPQGRGLMLKKGVVILGETPTTDKKAAIWGNWDSPGLNNLKTKFTFPYKKFPATVGSGNAPHMWNMIGCMPGTNEEGVHQVTHVGIAWVHLDGAFIYFGFRGNWASKWGNSTGWQGGRSDISPYTGSSSYPAFNYWDNWLDRVPNGTHPMDIWAGDSVPGTWDSGKAKYGSKRFIFGCRLDNAAVSDYAIDYSKGKVANFFGKGCNRWIGRICMYGSHIFIANNVLAKPTNCFKFTRLTSSNSTKTLLYDYADGGAIDVNKNLVSLYHNRCDVINGLYYPEDVVVIDNWLYSHGGKSFDMGGKWMIIKNNIIYREPNNEGDNVYGLGPGWELTLDGYKEATGSDDVMSRLSDMGGWNICIDSNYYTGLGGNIGNDGEGWMWQRWNGLECFSATVTHSIQGPTGEKGYIKPYDVHVLGMMQAWNILQGWTESEVGVAKVVNSKFTNYVADFSVVNNTLEVGGDANIDGLDEISSIVDFLYTCPSGTLNAPINVNVTTDVSKKCRTITWTDNSTNEIGFRIDRREQGNSTWKTLVYRPRNESNTVFEYSIPSGFGGGPVDTNICYHQIHEFNPQQWNDYTTDMTKNYEYRVVAINCNNNDEGAASPVITSVALNPLTSGLHYSLYPNPASTYLNIEINAMTDEQISIQLFSINGISALNPITNYPIKKGTQIIQIPTENLSNGIYFVKISTKNNLLTTKKIVVSK